VKVYHVVSNQIADFVKLQFNLMYKIEECVYGSSRRKWGIL